jgi:hypothetical protein
VATTIDHRTTTEPTAEASPEGASPPPATLPRRLALGLLAGAVYAATLAVVHLVRDDPAVTWGDVGLRAAVIGVIVPMAAALIPTRWANRSWVARGGTRSRRVGLVLLCLLAVVMVALRSYGRMA